MRIKIFRNIFITCTLTALLVSVLIGYVMYDGFFSNMQQNVRQTSDDYMRILDDAEQENQEILDNIPSTIFRITLISPQGEILFDNKSDTTENHSDRPEIIDALSEDIGESSRFSDTLQQQTYYYAQKLESGNILRVSDFTDTVVRTFTDSSFLILICFILAIIFSFLAARLATSRLVAPINSINVETPTENNTYIELTPLLLKIDNQNNMLKAQTADMQKMRDELGEIMEHMEEGLIVLNSHGSIISINQAALAIFNKSVQSCVGKYILEIHRGESFERIYDILQSGESGRIEIEENDRIYQVSISDIKSGGNILMFVDNTQERFAERMRREFSANVSHELKTPLQTISGYAELLKNDMVQEEDKPRFIDKIHAESVRMGMLIQDIIKLSRLDEDAKGMSKEDVDINKLTEKVVAQLNDKAEKKHITISIAENMPLFIKGIPTILEECIFNLIDNAIEYNKEGGGVDISTEENKNYVTLSISDTGIGIPTEEQGRVFERFYRVEKSRCRSGGGTGLGLSIVKHAIMVHGGDVELSSREDEGTTVTIRLPK